MYPLQSKAIICVSGSADLSLSPAETPKIAMELGRAIARAGAIITTGATTGFPAWSAAGAKEAGGFSVGISPAAHREEHLAVYQAPIDDMDFIMYTGFGYPMRDILLVRSSEAVIFGAGRIGTIHEFTIAFEDDKPIGILEGPWPTDEVIKNIIENSNRPSNHIIFDNDCDRLVKRLLVMIEEKRDEITRKSVGWDK